MKKTWNKLIIVSFIVLAVVACAAIVFLYPYYNEYKVFDGIEAVHCNSGLNYKSVRSHPGIRYD